MSTGARPIAFITGSASGFGLGLTRRLLADGWRIFATDESTGSLPELLRGADPDQLRISRLDVRDSIAVRASAAEARAWGPVGLLVNNAGFAVFGAQEELPVELFQDMLDVNVLGPARLTSALLPDLRASRGAVVQLSSVAGRTAFPESGFYAATKHALEAMTEALHQETAPFGVRVRLVEPGSFATGFLASAAQRSPAPPEGSAYAALRPLWAERKAELLEPPQDPELVVSAITESLKDEALFLRLVVGADAKRILEKREELGPDAWFRWSAARNTP